MGWRKSTCSFSNGNCVEVTTVEDLAVLVRDSQNPAGTVLALTADAWRDLTARVKTGGVT